MKKKEVVYWWNKIKGSLLTAGKRKRSKEALTAWKMVKKNKTKKSLSTGEKKFKESLLTAVKKKR